MTKAARKNFRISLFRGRSDSRHLVDLGSGPSAGTNTDVAAFMKAVATGAAAARKSMQTTTTPTEATFATIGGPHRFSTHGLAQFFGGLFLAVERGSAKALPGTGHKLTKFDLFHGHLVAESGLAGVIFHAKEYPSDMPAAGPQTAGSPFTSRHADFRYRNVMWFWPDNRIYAIDVSVGNEIYTKWLKDYVDEELPAIPGIPAMKTANTNALAALTLMETDFETVVGDVFYIAEAPGHSHEHHVFLGNLRS